MLVTSSTLSYYSTNSHVIRGRVARWLSIFLRRVGKVVAALNAVWIVSTGLLQFGSFYDQCYCNSSVMGLGKHAYLIVYLVSVGVGGMLTAWIGGFILAAGAALSFAGFMTLFINPPLPP